MAMQAAERAERCNVDPGARHVVPDRKKIGKIYLSAAAILPPSTVVTLAVVFNASA